MTKEEKSRWVYTADDEEPKCMRCDHVCGSQDRCDKCGPEHWWRYYQRTEVVEYDRTRKEI